MSPDAPSTPARPSQTLLFALIGFSRVGIVPHLLVAAAIFLWWTGLVGQPRFGDAEEAFFRAARHGDVPGIRQSLDAGMSVSLRSPADGRTALNRAAVLGRTDAVRELLARGADGGARGPDNKTALDLVTAAHAEEHDPAKRQALDAVAALLKAAEATR